MMHLFGDERRKFFLKNYSSKNLPGARQLVVSVCHLPPAVTGGGCIHFARFPRAKPFWDKVRTHPPCCPFSRVASCLLCSTIIATLPTRDFHFLSSAICILSAAFTISSCTVVHTLDTASAYDHAATLLLIQHPRFDIFFFSSSTTDASFDRDPRSLSWHFCPCVNQTRPTSLSFSATQIHPNDSKIHRPPLYLRPGRCPI